MSFRYPSTYLDSTEHVDISRYLRLVQWLKTAKSWRSLNLHDARDKDLNGGPICDQTLGSAENDL